MKLIDAYCAGDLDPASEKRCAAHAEKCAACRREMAHARKIMKAMKNLPGMKAPRGFESRIENRIFGGGSSSAAGRNIFTPFRLKIAASAAAVVVVAFVLFIQRDFIFKKNSVELASVTTEKSAAPDILVEPKEKKISGYMTQIPKKPAEVSTDIRREADERTDVSIIIAMNEVQTDRMIPSPLKSEEVRRDADLQVADDKSAEKETASKSAPVMELAKKDESRMAQGASASMPASVQVQQSANSQLDSIVKKVGGVIVATRNQPQAKQKRSAGKSGVQNGQQNVVTVQIPASNYSRFIELLNQIGPVKPQQRNKIPAKGSVQVEIQLEDEKAPGQ
jgi:hypothetical protein